MPISGRRRSLPYLLIAPVLAVTLAAGCGPQDTVVPEKRNPPRTAEPSPSSTPSPTASTTPSPTATTPPPIPAADGTNYKACADGTCEVAVSRPVDIRLGGPAGSGRVEIRKVLSNGLELELTLGSGGGGSGTMKFKGACGPVFRFAIAGGGGQGSFCNADGSAQPSPAPQAGMVALQVPGKTDKGVVVLRIVSG